MSRPDGRIEPGQPLRSAISARAWNRAQDAADLVLGQQGGITAGTSAAVPRPYTWVHCKPSVTVARWDIVAITGVEVTPTSDSNATATKTFEDTPVLTGGTPSDTTTAWGVAVEPIESGKIGRVAVAGVVQCKVEVTAADDQYVQCKSGGLKTGSSGEGLVLWKDGGTGSGKWAIVRLGAGGGGIVRGTFTAPWAKGSTKTVADAVTSGKSYSDVKNYFAAVGGTGTKACAIAYVGNEWILIAAEC